MISVKNAYAMMKDHPRFSHSQNVVEMALALNKFYQFEIDEEKVILSGILHDVTKNYDDDTQLLMLKKEGIKDDELYMVPSIWHAVTGMMVARDLLKITDQDILDAIYYHTTGKPEMSNLEKLIFLSDYIEKGRIGEHFEKVRACAFQNLDQAIVLMYEQQFAYLQKNNYLIYHLSIEAYKYYQKEVHND